jgi:outer membrane protein assembly factor BamB
MSDDSLNVLDVRTGTLHWRYPWKDDSKEPYIVGNNMFLVSDDNGAILLNIATNPPQPVWKQNQLYFSYFQGFVIYQNLAFGRCLGKKKNVLQCVSVDSGIVQWEHDSGPWGGITLAQDKLIIVTGNGRLIIANATSAGYQEIASAQIFEYDEQAVNKAKTGFWIQPVLSHGHIYIRSNIGDVACVSMK